MSLEAVPVTVSANISKVLPGAGIAALLWASEEEGVCCPYPPVTEV